MRFLVDADLPRATAAVVVNFGHEAIDVRDIGMGAAEDEDIAVYARDNQLCLITGDFGFADVRRYPPQDYAGIVVLGLPGRVDRDFILNMVRSFFEQAAIIARLPGRLAIVEPGRIRLRPA